MWIRWANHICQEYDTLSLWDLMSPVSCRKSGLIGMLSSYMNVDDCVYGQVSRIGWGKLVP